MKLRLQFRLRTLLIVVTLMTLSLGGPFLWRRQLDALRVAEEADVRESVFRHMLAESMSYKVERFLAFGWDDARPSPLIDPPDGYVNRFKDLGVRIRPA